jgi:replicative DNA helicase
MKYSAIEAERAVLSSILMDSRGDCMERANCLQPSDFTARSHQIVFDSCKRLFDDGKAVDTVTVVQNLTVLGRIKEIDGAYFVHKLATEFSIPGNLEHYIEEIKERARLFRLNEIASKIQTRSESCDSVVELVSEIEKDIYDLQKNQKNDNASVSASEELNRQIENYRNHSFGISTGIPSFDSVFGGLQKGQYYAIGGRPSAGKTALADQVTLHQLKNGRPVLYIALEASTERVFTKIACKHAGLIFTRFARREMNDSELKSLSKASEFIKNSPLILQRPYGITASDIRSTIRREHRNSGIELVVIDYLQKVTIPSRMDERRGVSEASQQVQQACLDTGVPALVLVQLNREGETSSRPSMRNIKESGQIEQDADNICLLWPEVDPFTVDPADMLPVMLSIEKNKDGMRGIDQRLYFDRPQMIFRERK